MGKPVFIADDHVKALRSMLAGDMDQYDELADRIERSDSPLYFNVLIASAFAVAVHRRFGQGYTASDIILFVADERTRHDDSADDFEPRVAERMVLAVLSGEPVHDIDDEAKADAQIALLLGLVDDEDLDDKGLDRLVEESRKAAEAAVQFQQSHSDLN